MTDRLAVLERWRAEPQRFIAEVLRDPETNRSFELLPAEQAFLAHMFATDDDGRLKYPELVYSSIKKSGKTTFAAITTIVIVLLFGGRYSEGYVVANDLEQAVSRVFEMIRRIVEASPLLAAEAKVTADKITFVTTGATITALASDYASAAGGHPTIAVFDELWGYTSERSRRLWDELVPVPTRKISCRLVVSYAGFEGESALLYELQQRGLSQPTIGTDLHTGDGLLMFWSHDPIAPWQDDKWLAQMRRSLRPNQYLRMIENRFVTTESTFVDMAAFDRCVDPQLTAIVSDQTLPIFVGVDASVKHDSTAIVAVTFDQPSQRVRVVFHRVFQPTPDVPLDFEAAVEATLIDLGKRFAVRRILFDPYQMQATAQRLTRAGLPIKEFPQSVPNLTAASQNLYELISGGNLAVYPSDQIRLAVACAVAIETPRGWRIGKDKQTHKIDVVVALAMACHAAVQRGPVEDDMVFVVPPIIAGTPRYIPGQGNSTGAHVYEPQLNGKTAHQLWVESHYRQGGGLPPASNGLW